MHSLIDFKFRSHFKAERGMHGQGKDMHGRNGKNCEMIVPVGSIIKDDETNEVLADLHNEGDVFIAAKGGKGGLGNSHFSSGSNRTPRIATKGKPGVERWLRIELKLIADIGLVGMPNAGKSTLLSKLSAANPKVADYPFTTLEPQLGVLHFKYDEPCIIADIPGLVKGAADGVGLGHKFLRHVERTRVLLHVVDCSDDHLFDNYQNIERELNLYKAELGSRYRVIVLTKTDLVDHEMVDEFVEEFKQKCETVIAVSCENGDNIEALKDLLEDVLHGLKEKQEEPDDH